MAKSTKALVAHVVAKSGLQTKGVNLMLSPMMGSFYLKQVAIGLGRK